MSNKGGKLLQSKLGSEIAWSEGDGAVGEIFLEHAILVSDVMATIELTCRKLGIVRLLHEIEPDLPVERTPFQWQVKLAGGAQQGVVPDRVFALEYTDANDQAQRAYYFLEADRCTMPVVRTNLIQTSFHRKLLAYGAT